MADLLLLSNDPQQHKREMFLEEMRMHLERLVVASTVKATAEQQLKTANSQVAEYHQQIWNLAEETRVLYPATASAPTTVPAQPTSRTSGAAPAPVAAPGGGGPPPIHRRVRIALFNSAAYKQYVGQLNQTHLHITEATGSTFLYHAAVHGVLVALAKHKPVWQRSGSTLFGLLVTVLAVAHYHQPHGTSSSAMSESCRSILRELAMLAGCMFLRIDELEKQQKQKQNEEEFLLGSTAGQTKSDSDSAPASVRILHALLAFQCADWAFPLLQISSDDMRRCNLLQTLFQYSPHLSETGYLMCLQQFPFVGLASSPYCTSEGLRQIVLQPLSIALQQSLSWGYQELFTRCSTILIDLAYSAPPTVALSAISLVIEHVNMLPLIAPHLYRVGPSLWPRLNAQDLLIVFAQLYHVSLPSGSSSKDLKAVLLQQLDAINATSVAGTVSAHAKDFALEYLGIYTASYQPSEGASVSGHGLVSFAGTMIGLFAQLIGQLAGQPESQELASRIAREMFSIAFVILPNSPLCYPAMQNEMVDICQTLCFQHPVVSVWLMRYAMEFTPALIQQLQVQVVDKPAMVEAFVSLIGRISVPLSSIDDSIWDSLMSVVSQCWVPFARPGGVTTPYLTNLFAGSTNLTTPLPFGVVGDVRNQALMAIGRIIVEGIDWNQQSPTRRLKLLEMLLGVARGISSLVLGAQQKLSHVDEEPEAVNTGTLWLRWISDVLEAFDLLRTPDSTTRVLYEQFLTNLYGTHNGAEIGIPLYMMLSLEMSLFEADLATTQPPTNDGKTKSSAEDDLLSELLAGPNTSEKSTGPVGGKAKSVVEIWNELNAKFPAGTLLLSKYNRKRKDFPKLLLRYLKVLALLPTDLSAEHVFACTTPITELLALDLDPLKRIFVSYLYQCINDKTPASQSFLRVVGSALAFALPDAHAAALLDSLISHQFQATASTAPFDDCLAAIIGPEDSEVVIEHCQNLRIYLAYGCVRAITPLLPSPNTQPPSSGQPPRGDPTRCRLWVAGRCGTLTSAVSPYLGLLFWEQFFVCLDGAPHPASAYLTQTEMSRLTEVWLLAVKDISDPGGATDLLANLYCSFMNFNPKEVLGGQARFLSAASNRDVLLPMILTSSTLDGPPCPPRPSETQVRIQQTAETWRIRQRAANDAATAMTTAAQATQLWDRVVPPPRAAFADIVKTMQAVEQMLVERPPTDYDTCTRVAQTTVQVLEGFAEAVQQIFSLDHEHAQMTLELYVNVPQLIRVPPPAPAAPPQSHGLLGAPEPTQPQHEQTYSARQVAYSSNHILMDLASNRRLSRSQLRTADSDLKSAAEGTLFLAATCDALDSRQNQPLPANLEALTLTIVTPLLSLLLDDRLCRTNPIAWSELAFQLDRLLTLLAERAPEVHIALQPRLLEVFLSAQSLPSSVAKTLAPIVEPEFQSAVMEAGSQPANFIPYVGSAPPSQQPAPPATTPVPPARPSNDPPAAPPSLAEGVLSSAYVRQVAQHMKASSAQLMAAIGPSASELLHTSATPQDSSTPPVEIKAWKERMASAAAPATDGSVASLRQILAKGGQNRFTNGDRRSLFTLFNPAVLLSNPTVPGAGVDAYLTLMTLLAHTDTALNESDLTALCERFDIASLFMAISPESAAVGNKGRKDSLKGKGKASKKDNELDDLLLDFGQASSSSSSSSSSSASNKNDPTPEVPISLTEGGALPPAIDTLVNLLPHLLQRPGYSGLGAQILMHGVTFAFPSLVGRLLAACFEAMSQDFLLAQAQGQPQQRPSSASVDFQVRVLNESFKLPEEEQLAPQLVEQWLAIVGAAFPIHNESLCHFAVAFIRAVLEHPSYLSHLQVASSSSDPVLQPLRMLLKRISAAYASPGGGGAPTLPFDAYTTLVEALTALCTMVPLAIDLAWELCMGCGYLVDITRAHHVHMSLIDSTDWSNAAIHQTPTGINALVEYMARGYCSAVEVSALFFKLDWTFIWTLSPEPLSEMASHMLWLCCQVNLFEPVRVRQEFLASALQPPPAASSTQEASGSTSTSPAPQLTDVPQSTPLSHMLWRRITPAHFLACFYGSAMAKVLRNGIVSVNAAEQIVVAGQTLAALAVQMADRTVATQVVMEIRSVLFLFIIDPDFRVWHLPLRDHILLLRTTVLPLALWCAPTSHPVVTSVLELLAAAEPHACVRDAVHTEKALLAEELLQTGAGSEAHPRGMSNRSEAQLLARVQSKEYVAYFSKIRGLILHFCASAEEGLSLQILNVAPLVVSDLDTLCEVLDRTLLAFLRTSQSAKPVSVAVATLSLPQCPVQEFAQLCLSRRANTVLAILLRQWIQRERKSSKPSTAAKGPTASLQRSQLQQHQQALLATSSATSQPLQASSSGAAHGIEPHEGDLDSEFSLDNTTEAPDTASTTGGGGGGAFTPSASAGPRASLSFPNPSLMLTTLLSAADSINAAQPHPTRPDGDLLALYFLMLDIISDREWDIYRPDVWERSDKFLQVVCGLGTKHGRWYATMLPTSLTSALSPIAQLPAPPAAHLRDVSLACGCIELFAHRILRSKAANAVRGGKKRELTIQTMETLSAATYDRRFQDLVRLGRGPNYKGSSYVELLQEAESFDSPLLDLSQFKHIVVEKLFPTLPYLSKM